MENDETKKAENGFGVTRRSFLTQTGMAAAAFTILPSHLWGANKKIPSDLLNIAVVGIGGKGASDAQGVSSQNIVALCDIDDTMGMEVRKTYPKATQYRDYRKMLEKEKNLDAVV
ncbi:MAG: twin-arginine translocation signal domain-containing protein, partial [Melioribacteraceae bacterium]